MWRGRTVDVQFYLFHERDSIIVISTINSVNFLHFISYVHKALSCRDGEVTLSYLIDTFKATQVPSMDK